MLGFISGLIEAELVEAQQQKNAEEYAKQKIKSERGMGFTSPKKQKSKN